MITDLTLKRSHCDAKSFQMLELASIVRPGMKFLKSVNIYVSVQVVGIGDVGDLQKLHSLDPISSALTGLVKGDS
jgi:hypothetical protein